LHLFSIYSNLPVAGASACWCVLLVCYSSSLVDCLCLARPRVTRVIL